jgi:uncharacterized protein YndB with AHSA1/START domain
VTESSVKHATFVIERRYEAAPARVFRAFSDREAKAAWSSCHEGATHELDFRVGGREYYRGGPPGGPLYTNHTLFQDIVPERRIVYSYDMAADGERISVSLVTIELIPDGAGTRLVFTEQGAFLDGREEPARREHGTRLGLDNLEPSLG